MIDCGFENNISRESLEISSEVIRDVGVHV